MSITVKNLIEKYSAIQENDSTIYENHMDDSYLNIDLNDSLSEEEEKVFVALNMGVVTEKVLAERRAARQ